MLSHALAACALVLVVSDLGAQPVVIFNGTNTTCSGAFLDSGGQGASGYSNNEDLTFTICPDSPGGAISLDFLTFTLSTAGAAPIDQMTIHDGNSTAAPILGNWTGNGLQGQVVSASGSNASGCLTIVFHSNNTGTGVFAATITCYQPCDRPIAVGTHGPSNPMLICPGESVTFNSSASYAAPGFSIATRQWDFGDGTILNNAGAIVSHTYDQPGGYTAQLYLVDNNGCASTNLVSLVTLVGTEPNFVGTGGVLTACAGETVCLDGVVNATTWTEDPAPNLGGGVFLPDNVGECFSSTITFDQFPSGATLNNVNGLLSICMDVEHSFIGDLVISIISPTGETVIMHQQGGGATFLGIPVDNDLTPNAQGTCWNYCWSPTATNGTWVANAGGTLPSGTYQSLNSLAGLVGSQLNGTWTIEVCDLWASDNGFICNWSLDFDPSLFDDLIEFTPIYGAVCDSSYWTGPNITSTNGNCNQICVTPPGAGTYDYVYHVVDNFGCTYDTTLTVTVIPELQVTAGPDASTCNTPVQLGASVIGGGFPTSCDYVLTLYDSFGDGWTGFLGLGSNGSSVTITVDGVATSWTLPSGSQGSVNIPVTQGSTISISYTAGSIYNGEQSYTLFNSSGGVVFSSPQGPASGPSWSGTASCPGGSYVYTWSPATGLNDPNIANPVATVSGTMQYCVTVYQIGHPLCTATDCMTITVDQTVDPGTNANIALCSNGVATDLFSQLGGSPTAGGTWTAPGGSAHSGSFIPGADPTGIYTYTVGGAGACGVPLSSTVNVTVYPLPIAGIPTGITVCATDAAQPLFPLLGGTAMPGGTWTGPGGTASAGSYDPAVHAPGVYTYTVAGTTPCPDASATVTVTEEQPPDAGEDNSLSLCSTDAAFSMQTQLNGTPDGGGSWTGPGGVASGGGFDPATDVPGMYTYTVQGVSACPSDQAILTIAVSSPPDPGTPGTITLCSSDAPASLFAQLGGTPDAGGTWSGPSTVVGGMIDPASMNAGVYTYTVLGTAPCPDETATVTVTINSPPDPGTPGTITLCSSDAPASLFAQLGGTPDAGGTWSGPSPVVGGMVDPASMNAGVYTYTVLGTAPCPDEIAMVTVTINNPPDPGTPGTITLCSSDAPTSLFAQLGGTPDAGGTWNGPSTVVGGIIDPASMNPGVYTYTVSGTAPCPDETATVTVTINSPPDPGTPGTITLCSSDAPTSLFAQLGGTPDAGGTWSGPSPVVGDMIDPASMNPGVYTYTVSGTAPCPNETASVTVTINSPPDPGTPGTITLCSSDAPTSLFAQLGGTPDAGGTWSGPSPVVGGMVDPASMNAGVYTYTVSGTAPCPDEIATVTVSINSPPDPGTPGTITLCSSDAPASLFAQLGGTPDAGGTWSGPSPVVGGMIDPASMNPGVYTYTVSGTAPCPDETASVTVTINSPPDPGTPGTITLCSSDAPTSLLAQLGGTPDAGGTWSGPSPVVGGMIDPASMNPGVYTYTVSGTAPCPDETATVTVTINNPPDPGTPGTITLCSSDAPASLLAQLGGTPDAGGTWSGPSPVVGGMVDPASMNAGVYTYTVTGMAPCPDEIATVTVVINQLPDAGINGGLTLCSSSTATSLFSGLNGTPDPGGVWSGPGGGASNGTFTPGVSASGAYLYTVLGTAPCPDATASVDVIVVTNPDAGTPGTTTLCSTDAAILLFDELGGSPDAGGTWTGPSSVVGGQYDPMIMNPGVYTYTITVPPPCTNASSTVTILEVAPPNAGNDGAITLCISSPAASLFAALSGGAQTGGTWSGPSPVVGGMFDPSTMVDGVYTYTMTGNAPCPNDQSTVNVNVVAAPDAGTPGALSVCSTDGAFDLFAELGGSPDPGGVWSGPSSVAGGMYDPANMSPGVYTYTITVPLPCTNASSTVTVTEVAPPDAGNDGAITLCISSPAASLFAALSGGAQAGGTWTGPSPVVGGMFDPSTMVDGLYTYSVTGNAPCPNDQSTVNVNVVAAPDAGTPGALSVCSTDGAFDLFTELGGSPDAGGVWSGPSSVAGGIYDPANMSPGVYTYTITVPPPCTNASSTVTVTEVAPPDAGNDGAITLCISSPAASLFAALSGGAQAGGTWTGPSPVVGGMFNPSTMIAGIYTYTVTGNAPCPNDQSTVTVNVVAAPDAGTPGMTTVCSTDVAFDLFTELGGSPDPGGVWSGPSPVASGMYDPANMSPGVYTYTIAVPPPCVDASSTVTIEEVQPPDAGLDGALTVCITGPSILLFDALGGSPQTGGSWSGPSPVTGGSFNPATMNAGPYTYTVTGTPPCPNDISTATVLVVTEPDPGEPGTLTVCASDGPTDLFLMLEGSPDLGGGWTTPVGSSFDGLFDPATMVSGVYTYSIIVPPPCSSVSSSVTVEVIAPPNAGLDASITLCNSGAPTGLFDVLGGEPETDGTWTTGSGTPFSGTFDPASLVAGPFTYTVTGIAPCPADQAIVTVMVTEQPYPGEDGIVNLCIVGDPVDLFPVLGGADPNGAWTGPTVPFSGTYTPGTDEAGPYTYTVTGVAPCPSASAVISVNVLLDADAGIDGASTFCGSDSPVDLFPLLQGNPDPGGSWFDPSGNAVGSSFDPSSGAEGSYTYILFVPAPCENDTAAVQVSIVQPVNAGEDGNTSLCSDDAPVSLFNMLGGSPDLGGSWEGPSVLQEGVFDPGMNDPGGYVYTVTAAAPCPDMSAMVDVTVNPLPDAGTNGTITLCPEAAAIQLFGLLGGTPMTGGSWTGPDGQESDGIFDPATSPQGVYTYTVLGTLPCPNATASSTATVYLIAPPDAGPDQVSCELEEVLNANGNWTSGSWTGPSGSVFSDPTDPGSTVSVTVGGSYTFTWSVLSMDGCASQDQVTITFTEPIVPIASGTDALCAEACDGTATVTATGGNTAGNGYDFVWSGGVPGLDGSTVSGLCAGTYSVTVLDMNGCSGIAEVVIGEPAPMTIELIRSTDEVCPGNCDGTITIDSGTAVQFSINNGADWQVWNSFTGLCPGDYDILVQSELGCMASGAASVGTPPPVVAHFTWSPDPVYVTDPTVQFVNASTINATGFSWDFGGLGSSYVASPTFTFPGVLGDEYVVCLDVTDDNGCPDQYCTRIIIEDVLIVHVPNAFTPNNDGINDEFVPVFNVYDAVDYEFLIFDRWGELIFQSKAPGFPWDGRVNGELVETEVYVWRLYFRDPRVVGRQERIGHVTVLK